MERLKNNGKKRNTNTRSVEVAQMYIKRPSELLYGPHIQIIYDSKKTTAAATVALDLGAGRVEVSSSSSSSSTCGLAHLHKQWHEPATGFPAHAVAVAAISTTARGLAPAAVPRLNAHDFLLYYNIMHMIIIIIICNTIFFIYLTSDIIVRKSTSTQLRGEKNKKILIHSKWT